jgi:hypothetical protein
VRDLLRLRITPFFDQPFVSRRAETLRDQLFAFRMHQAEFQIGRLLDIRANRADFRLGQARELNQNTIGALWQDDRFGNAECIDALAQNLHRLLEHRLVIVRRDIVRVCERFGGIHADQKRAAALQIQSQLHFAGRRALHSVQNGLIIFRRRARFDAGEILRHVVRADREHQRLILIRVGLGAGARNDRVEIRVLVRRQLLEDVDLTTALRRVKRIDRPRGNEDDGEPFEFVISH